MFVCNVVYWWHTHCSTDPTSSSSYQEGRVDPLLANTDCWSTAGTPSRLSQSSLQQRQSVTLAAGLAQWVFYSSFPPYNISLSSQFLSSRDYTVSCMLSNCWIISFQLMLINSVHLVHNNTTVVTVTHTNISTSVVHCYPTRMTKLSFSTSFFTKTLEELSSCSKSWHTMIAISNIHSVSGVNTRIPTVRRVRSLYAGPGAIEDSLC